MLMENHGTSLSEEEMKVLDECVNNFQCQYDGRQHGMIDGTHESRRDRSRLRMTKKGRRRSSSQYQSVDAEPQIDYRGIISNSSHCTPLARSAPLVTS